MLGGAVRVTLNGIVVADDDGFGLERSALALLRTIDQDHNATSDRRVPTEACSNFYVDWTVRHGAGNVHISDARRFDALRPTEIHFEAATCVMSRAAYRNEVVQFAAQVHEAYFADGDKVIDDPDERQFFDAFWAEYDSRLVRHGDAHGPLGAEREA